ncbi:MAG: GMC family oxidoreductase [Syntrophaceae bacterium]|nr:GMC family oxidoreductase [Syntrophaceae bacterium]
MSELSANTIIVGSGPGGATIARELARSGDDVIILEKGKDHQWPVGTIAAYATMYDIKKSKDGIIVRRGITTGGSTMLYSGNAYDPPAFLKEELGIDLSQEVAETKKELSLHPIPDSFFKNYKGTMRLVAAAAGLGYNMEPQARFIDPALCDPTCDRCLFGCKKGAKWTSREYLADAIKAGARLFIRHGVERVLSSHGAAEGVLVKTPHEERRIMANRIILAAGGIGTPIILKKSGIADAGSHFFTDPMSVMVGLMKEGTGTFHEITYTFADESHVGEYVMGNVGAVNAFLAQMVAFHLPYARRIIHMRRLTGMFVKLCDEPNGSIEEDGTMNKRLTDVDEKNMACGVEAAKRIMVRAGVIPESISIAKGIGGHPGGTAAIGRVIGKDLQTKIRNLYVCDNSVMPHSGGIPPVLTLIALGKKAARSIFARANGTA